MLCETTNEVSALQENVYSNTRMRMLCLKTGNKLCIHREQFQFNNPTFCYHKLAVTDL